MHQFENRHNLKVTQTHNPTDQTIKIITKTIFKHILLEFLLLLYYILGSAMKCCESASSPIKLNKNKKKDIF